MDPKKDVAGLANLVYLMATSDSSAMAGQMEDPRTLPPFERLEATCPPLALIIRSCWDGPAITAFEVAMRLVGLDAEVDIEAEADPRGEASWSL
jgi:hypothetical protein